MRLLVIGGNRFIGKHVVLSALERGHSVTLFNRGNHPLPHPEAEHIKGDRDVDRDLKQLVEGRWDAVVDTSGYFPRQVRSAAEALSGRVGHYTFISSISAYAHQDTPFQDEAAALAELEDLATEELTGQTYGGLKVLCERTLEAAFPGRRLVLRPGLVVGPDDPTDRFTYWVVRASRGGDLLAPRVPEMPVQWIDVRDLALWLVGLLERGQEGTYNVVSEPDRFRFGDLLSTAREISGSDARVVWVDEGFLLQRGVQPFVDLPLWISGEGINFYRIATERAQDAGLRVRDLDGTVGATLSWFRGSGRKGLRAGLSAEREQALLAEWRRRASDD